MTTWTGFIIDHLATVLKPPDHEAFDFSNDQYAHDTRHSPPTPPNNAQNFLASLYQMLASAGPTTSTPTPASAPILAPAPAPSLVAPTTPESLRPFLEFACKEFGAGSSDEYVDAFARERIGPDILPDLEASELENYGVPKGDVYRLKRAARSWEDDEERSRPFKEPRVENTDKNASNNMAPAYSIAFNDCPSPPPPGYERTEAERAGRPRPGRKGNFCWEKSYPGGDGYMTFWADMPSPTMSPHDPLLAPPGTVKLRVASGHYIDVLRAPQPEILDDEEGSLEDLFL